MNIIDSLIWLFLIGYPIYSYFTYQQEISAVEQGRKTLSTSYWQTMALLWPIAILALMSESYGGQFCTENTNKIMWGLLLVIVLSAVFIYGLAQTQKSDEHQQAVLEQMSSVAWIMPKSNYQLGLYLIGVCTTAGIAEEIIYRGYLLPFLTNYMDNYLAVIVASVIFGLPHIYQGVSGVVKTSIMGVIFCLLVLVFDSLLIAIFCHILVDAYSGYLYFIAHKNKKPA